MKEIKVKCIEDVVMNSDAGEDAGKVAFIAGKVYDAYDVDNGHEIFVYITELPSVYGAEHIIYRNGSDYLERWFPQHFVFVTEEQVDAISDYDRAMRGI